MSKRFFNIAYFVAALAVFAWLLRDHPHARLVPILSMVLCGFYGFLAVVSLLKPSGFAVSGEVLPMKKQRCLRRLALFLPIPALLYFAAYSACMNYAGECKFINKLFNPIARFEKCQFGRDRMLYFVASTHPRLLEAAERNEMNQHWRAAESYYRAATGLENRVYDRRMPSSYAIMACLYDKMGRKDKAEKFYIRAEALANHKCESHERICRHSQLVSVPRVLRDLTLAGKSSLAIQAEYPWLARYQNMSETPASIIGRQFAALNMHTCDRHDWCKSSKCTLATLNCGDHDKCGDKDCKDKHCDGNHSFERNGFVSLVIRHQ